MGDHKKENLANLKDSRNALDEVGALYKAATQSMQAILAAASPAQEALRIHARAASEIATQFAELRRPAETLTAELLRNRNEWRELLESLKPIYVADVVGEQLRAVKGVRDQLQQVREQIASALSSNYVREQLQATREIAELARQATAQQSVRDWSELLTAVQQSFASTQPEVERIAAAVAESVAVVEPGTARIQAQLPRINVLVNGNVTYQPAAGAEEDTSAVREAKGGDVIPSHTGVKWFDALPIYQRLLLLYLILHLLPALLDSYFDRWLQEDASPRREAIAHEVNDFLGPDSAAMLRCVRASKLRVRESADSSATVVDHVVAQQSVVALAVERNWTRIQYIDKGSGEMKEGWVASTFLSRLAC